ncbi:hypothetical protein HK405_012334 [Cladochytrium tenue]|nr:hypothetical protein HK405_012334 [Cladochytrium tenue]
MTTWRWAYGAFAIIMPFVFLPLAAVFKFYENKAVKAGIIQRTPSGRSLSENLAYNFVEFDVIGVLLLMAAFLLFLLPFSMQTYNLATYNSATFIAMVVVGVLLFFVFAAWERWYAPVQFIRWEIFRQPTMLGACCLAAVLYFSFYCWDLYYYYFVYVVFDLGVSDTGYMTQIYNIGSCFWSVVFGLYVRYTHHFKYACLLFGLPLMFLGAGLLVHFRGSSQGLAGVIGAQVCIAIAGGTLVIGEDMAGMAAAGHDGVAMVLSLLSLAASVGGAIGYAVAAAIYASTFPAALQSALPNDTASDWQTIYNGGYIAQTAYPVGSATRDAIDYAWGQSQMYGAIAATCILVLAIPCIMVWKNYRVDRQQNKGTML